MDQSIFYRAFQIAGFVLGMKLVPVFDYVELQSRILHAIGRDHLDPLQPCIVGYLSQ